MKKLGFQPATIRRVSKALSSPITPPGPTPAAPARKFRRDGLAALCKRVEPRIAGRAMGGGEQFVERAVRSSVVVRVERVSGDEDHRPH